MAKDPLRRNALLAQLPDREYAELKPHLQLVRAEIKQSAYQPGTPIGDVYFPLTSVYSVVALADGKVALEVATIGYEGMVGLPLYLGATTSPQAAFCQVSGDAVRLGADQFRQALNRDGALHARLSRFTEATMVQIAQNVVCNGSHSTQARMARWLLTTRDRVDSDKFDLTQEFLALMLGVRRATVSEVAQKLQVQALIHYRRGVITITDPRGLEHSACECYRIVKAEFDAITDQGRKHR